MSLAIAAGAPSRIPAWRTIFAGLSASLVGIGLARFAYTPLIPPLIDAHWFAAADVVRLGAANLAGYLVGAIAGRALAARVGNAATLRAMMLAVTAAFIACAFPLSVGWFFLWRLASGVAGGAIMVLVAATLMPHVSPARRGLTVGAIFLGLGLGIAASGSLVPLLLAHGLRDTWIGLAAICGGLTAASWFAWPPAIVSTGVAVPVQACADAAPARALTTLYVQYALVAVGVVPAMLFLVDFVARGLHAGTRVGAFFWLLYGMGAMVGPPLYGLLGDRLGARHALRWVLAAQAAAGFGLHALHSRPALAAVVVVVGTFPPGIVALVLARIHQVEPHDAARQDAAWRRATIVFAAFQAVAAYACSALFNASGGDHRLLFLVAAIALLASVVVDFAPLATSSFGRVTSRPV